MNYIKFDKEQLINLENSRKFEIIDTGKSGGWLYSTIILCNTRKYHCLLATPQPGIDDDKHVLLSSLDLEVIRDGEFFHCGVHRYKGGTYFPKGHKYLQNAIIDKYPKITYGIGDTIITAEFAFLDNECRTVIKYKLEEGASDTKIRLSPFLAFRNVHFLTHANNDADTSYEIADNGIRMRLYSGYTPIYMQFSKSVNYIHNPQWNMNIEYTKEIERGYESTEDLIVPGYFETTLKKGEELFFSAGISEINADHIEKLYLSDAECRLSPQNFEDSMQIASKQFITHRNDRYFIQAGLPFYGTASRSTFLSVYGLSISKLNKGIFKKIIDSSLKELNGFKFPSHFSSRKPIYNNSDVALWFIYALQKYSMHGHKIWEVYGKYIKQIISGYLEGDKDLNINIKENGLLWAGDKGLALTWMDCVVNGKPVTARTGYAVEVNALWYNALLFTEEQCNQHSEFEFAAKIKQIHEKLKPAFIELFWNNEKGYLADYSDGKFTDWTIRPNQIMATAMPYSPLDEIQMESIIQIVKNKLLTPRGLRTLSPDDPNFKGVFSGNSSERDIAYHNGCIFPFLLSFFAKSFLKVYDNSGLYEIKKLYEGFKCETYNHGINSIPELYEGNPPYRPAGAISQASSVASLLEIEELLKKYENQKI